MSTMAAHSCTGTTDCATEPLILMSEAEFQERLVRFFGPFESVRPMEWGCVRKSMVYFAPFFKVQKFFDLYFDYVFGLFEEFRVRDRAAIVLGVQKYCRLKLCYCGFGMTEFPLVADSGVPLYEYFSVPRYVDQLLSRSFIYRDLSMVRRILRHIAPICLEWEDLAFYADHVMDSITRDPSLHHTVFFQLVEEGRMERRRLKLVLMAVDFVLRERMQNCQDAISGFKLLLQAIPDPHVTWVEIYRFLCRITVTPNDATSVHAYIRGFLESCARLFPECQRTLEPRSLRHLARCAVRRWLGRAHTLPHGVWELQLPRELEDYVLLQETKDQFRPVVRPLSREKVFVLRRVPDVQLTETIGLESG